MVLPMPSNPGLPRDGVAGGVGELEKVVADGGEPFGVGEAVELELADLDGVVLAGHFDGDAAVLGDGEGIGDEALGEGELGHELVAVGGDELAVGVDLEGAVAGVGVGAVVGHDAEEAVAFDGEVGDVLGVLQGALGEVALGGGELDAVAHLHGHGDDGVLGGGSAGHLGRSGR